MDYWLINALQSGIVKMNDVNELLSDNELLRRILEMRHEVDIEGNKLFMDFSGYDADTTEKLCSLPLSVLRLVKPLCRLLNITNRESKRKFMLLISDLYYKRK